MKKYLSGLATGIVLTLLLGSLAIGALAVSGDVSFNLSAIKFNGEVISEAGEGYALANGCVAPASITYTDEKRGGTTYLPARRVSELLGVDIGWDAASGAVTIGKTPDTTAPSTDYSDWSAEDEAAYQEFKGMWRIKPRKGYEYIKSDLAYPNSDATDGMVESYTLTYVGNLSREEISAAVDQAYEKGFTKRLASEIQSHGAPVIIWFYYNEEKYENWCGWYDGRFN